MNRALTWMRGLRSPVVQHKHSPADRPVVERITPPGWPQVRINVTADGWHLVIAVCRDLLNPHAVHARSEPGANLVLAPCMSDTLLPFGGPVAQLVGATQALVAIANNPIDWSTGLPSDPSVQPGRALFGHPAFAQQTRQVPAAERRTGIGLPRVGSAQLHWLSSAPDRNVGAATLLTQGSQPSGVPLVASQTTVAPKRPATPRTLRPAAVLALLTGTPAGPHVVLTQRAPDLRHYAGQLVLPGGATDAADADAVATALRKAREEVSTRPASTSSACYPSSLWRTAGSS